MMPQQCQLATAGRSRRLIETAVNSAGVGAGRLRLVRALLLASAVHVNE
jgi:hypothetical protein